MNGPIVVVDNGASYCRVGLAGESEPRRSFQNAAAKSKSEGKALLGDMLDSSRVVTQLSLRRPFDRGYLVNWDLEAEIWTRAFKSFMPQVRSCRESRTSASTDTTHGCVAWLPSF